jgi:phospholipid-binding lipoprotein MlaA
MKSVRLALPGHAVLLVLSLSGCATAPAKKPSAQDPWESMNRAVYRFNDAIDRAALKPVAKGYRNVTPDWFRQGVGNFFTNLDQPTVIVNDLLQGKPKDALMDTGRLLINTVFGLGGVLDLASANDMPLNDEDFGQTLAVWGVPSGPYLMLPFLGPSTLRDGPAKVGDYYTHPAHYADLKIEEEIAINAVEIVDKRARLLSSEDALERTYDKYAFIRNAWLQRREYQIKDGEVPEDEESMEEEEPVEPEPTEGAADR